MNIFIISGLILALLILMLFLKITVECHVQQNEDDFNGSVTFFGFFRLIHYTIEIPEWSIDDETPSVVYKETEEGLGMEKTKKGKLSISELKKYLEMMQNFLDNVKGFYYIVKSFLSKTTLVKLDWKTSFGLDDAAKTGEMSGLLWGIKGGFIGILSYFMKLSQYPKIEIHPCFQQLKLSSTFQCIVSFRIGYAILAGLKVIRYKRKHAKLFKSSFNDEEGSDLHA